MSHRAAILLLALVPAFAASAPAAAQRFDGFNIITIPVHAYGTPAARKTLVAVRRAGANTIAVVPFLWQRDPQHASLVRGNGMPDGALRIAIREAHDLNLKVVIKPHVWVEGSWAGSVEPKSDVDWRR